MFEDGLIECSNGDCYRIAEMGGLLETGRFANVCLVRSSLTHRRYCLSLPSLSRTLDTSRLGQIQVRTG